MWKFSRFRALRKAIRDQQAPEPGIESELIYGPPKDWRYWGVVKGKNAIMIGGTPKENARARIQDSLTFADLNWIWIGQMKQVETVCQRIRAGSIDMVILLQSFCPHSAANKVADACKSTGTMLLPVERGYGITQIQRAVEEHIGGERVGGQAADRSVEQVAYAE